jgi:DNA-binding LytR/AlgR family response regulator
VDYLLKPFSFQRFVKAVGKVPLRNSDQEIGKETPSKEYFIKVGYEYVRIAFDDIFYIMADGDYCEIVLPEKKFLSAEPLKKWLEMLPENNFARVHKSFIVNTDKINKVLGNQLNLSNGKTLPLGRAFKEDFINRFLN